MEWDDGNGMIYGFPVPRNVKGRRDASPFFV